MDPLAALAGALLLVASLFAMLQLPILRNVFPYALTETRFEVRVLGLLAIFWIDYARMVGVSRWTSGNFSIVKYAQTIRLGNRFGPALVIEARGFPKFTIVTPDDPDDFMRTIERRMHAVTRRGRP